MKKNPCETCKYKYKCYTLNNRFRPKKVRVNWNIIDVCGMCTNGTFVSGIYSIRRHTDTNVLYCKDTEQLVHFFSPVCDKFKPKKRHKRQTLYDEITEVIEKTKGSAKLPRYCVIEEVGTKEKPS